MLLNQQHQADIDGVTPMPTDRVDDASSVETASAETLTWLYSNSGVWASATGQAAGTIVAGKLTYSGVTNGTGSAVGNKNDTSLSFAAATRCATLVQVPESDFSRMLKMTVAQKVVHVATWLTTAGYYAIDHRRGEIWVKMKDTVADDSVTYKYQTPVSGGSGLASNKIQGNIAHDSVDSGNPVKIGGKASTSKPSAVANGDRVNAYIDEYGRIHTVDEGGSSVLPVTHRSPQDFTATYTSNVSMTITGAPFTVENATCTVAYIYYKPTAGTWQAPLVNGVNGVSITSAANVITVAGAGTPFASSDIYVVGIIYQDKGYTPATDSNRTEEINPINLSVVEDSLVDTTNIAAAATYYPSSLGMDMLGVKNFSLTGKYVDGDAVATTLSVQGTNDEDSTNADWVNIQGQINGLASATVAIPTVTGTVAGVTGVAVVPGTVCDLLTTAVAQTVKFTWDFDNLNYKYVRVVLTPGDATNTAIIKSRRTY